MQVQRMDLSEVFGKIAYGTQPIQIPYFQRAYVWDKREWERLAEDLLQLDPNASGEELFFGSLIFKKLPAQQAGEQKFNGVQVLVDGQQRLTTLVIALKILTLFSKDSVLDMQFQNRMHVEDWDGNEYPSIIHNRTDHTSFAEILALNANKALDNKDKSRVKGAYNYLRSALKGSGLAYDKVLNSIAFAVIQLDVDENEQLVFDATNSIGKRLASAELLKNYFFDQSREQEYDTIWKPVFEKDNETRQYWEDFLYSTARMNRIDTLISAVLRAKVIGHRDSNQKPISKAQRQKLLASGRVVGGYKGYIKRRCADEHSKSLADVSPAEEADTREDVVKEIVETAKVFQSMFPPSVGTAPPQQDATARLALLTTQLKLDSPIPYMLFIKMNVPDEAEQDEMFRVLESYLMRRLIADKSGAKYSKLFDDILDRGITNPEDLKAYFADRTDDLADVTDRELKSSIRERTDLTNNEARTILYMLEDRLVQIAFAPLSLRGIGDYSLEHLMPRKWREHWNDPAVPDARAVERDAALQTLGNLALVTTKMNIAMSNSPWQEKVKGNGKHRGLKENADLKTMFGATRKRQWDVEQIKNRADTMYESCKAVWPSARV